MEDRAPRCQLCCEHGQPYATIGWCGWCDDVSGGYADPIDPGDPQWLCPHGVGKVPGGEHILPS